MQLHHLTASRLLMQAVDILRDHRLQLSGLLQLCELPMRRVRLRVQRQHLILIEAVKLLRLPHKEGVTDNRLRRILILHMIKAILAPEVRNPAFGRNTRPSEENNIIASIYDLLQLSDLVHIHCETSSHL